MTARTTLLVIMAVGIAAGCEPDIIVRHNVVCRDVACPNGLRIVIQDLDADSATIRLEAQTRPPGRLQR